MPITVVTTRDYEGAPTTRDVYADAVRYRIGDSNLEVYSDKALLAFYGSGNWQTVLVDDPVQVHTGPVDPSVYAGMPVSPGPTTSDRAAGGGPSGGGPSGGFAPAEVLPRVPSTVLQQPRPSVPTEIVPAAAETPLPGAVNASEEMLERSASMRRVRFAPKVFRAARPGATPREPSTSWSPPSSIRPVVFRPKKYKAAPDVTVHAEDDPAGDDET